ncbi:hypothetical protein [Flavobacterium sedimenticola]|uniref:Uncharacterized protein n=1 Tax=Flavobacterium sedimenticola TaxID=3043286 RepID=A0ABT6XMM2_9FLAO|nr:hypothetical protein [Flavobacterium sedimenticola]MDI9256328.1 hypothetical protein [Flavobacterium sedimenticola]
MELYENTVFPQVKQVNDIANLSNRNSNVMPSVKIQKTANNVRNIEGVSLVGNQSNAPYRQLECDVIDADTGEHLIYKGWAVLVDSNEKDYIFNIYDGVIDFYKEIENTTITQIGVPELNHEKNLANVVGTWTDTTLPYRYILADYNGNNTASGNINIDFQVPSASIPYLWDKIFNYIGWTYSGTIFQHEKFKNAWLSYPKPVSTETPVTEEVTTQNSQLTSYEVQYPVGGGVFLGSVTYANIFPSVSSFNPAYYNFTTGIQVAGLYRFSFSAETFSLSNGSTSSRIQIIVRDTLNQIVSTSYVDIANGNYIDLLLNAGERIFVSVVYMDSTLPFNGFVNPSGNVSLSGEVTTSMNLITGFSLGFDQAFIDFQVTQFVRDMMVRFGLTPFKDKYKNHITFLTLYELLQNTNVNDMSDNFVAKIGEKTKIGNYAKRNYFKYKYNDDEMKHNNGYLSIADENLAEEITILNSSFYSPERLKSVFLGGCNIYKIWDKEIKDDETVTYKDLDGRFYLMRAEMINEEITLGSNILGGTVTVPFYFRESYYRLKFDEILYDWHRPMSAIFDKAKLITADFWQSPKQISNFDFSRLIYVRQLSSYFIANKIPNFTKGKPTRFELIEVDYFTQQDIVNPEEPDYTIEVGEPVLEDCQINLPVTTDYETPVMVIVNVFAGAFNELSTLVYNQFSLPEPITAELSGGEVTFGISMLPANALGYKFSITIISNSSFLSFTSNLSPAIVLDGTCYEEPSYPETLVINSIENLGTEPSAMFQPTYRYFINYTHTGIPPGTIYLLKVEGYSTILSTWLSIGDYIKTDGDDGTQLVVGYGINKIRISINDVISNEVNV